MLHRRLLEPRGWPDALDAPVGLFVAEGGEGARRASAAARRARERALAAHDADGALLAGLLRAVGGVRRALDGRGRARRRRVRRAGGHVEEADAAVGAVALAGWLLECHPIYCMPPSESAAHCLDAEPLLRVDLELGIAGGGERATVSSFTVPAARAGIRCERALAAARAGSRARGCASRRVGDLGDHPGPPSPPSTGVARGGRERVGAD